MLKILIGLLIILANIFNFEPALAQVNTLRVEQEGKLLVPADQVEAVWQYLQSEPFDPNFSVSSSEEIFSDTYYDTPKLQLLDQQFSVRHRGRQNLTNPEDRKSERELVQIKLSGIDTNQLNRGEYKFEVDLSQAGISDQHPLLAIIKKDQRNEFIDQLNQLQTPVNSLRPILQLSDRRRRIYISRNETPVMTLSLDQVASKRLWAKAEFIELETELNEITYTESNDTDRQVLNALNVKIMNQIMKRFPEIKPDPTPKYNKAFDLLEAKIPWFRFLIRWGLV